MLFKFLLPVLILHFALGRGKSNIQSIQQWKLSEVVFEVVVAKILEKSGKIYVPKSVFGKVASLQCATLRKIDSSKDNFFILPVSNGAVFEKK